METLTVESPIPTISSPVPTACLNDSSETSSEARLVSKRVDNQEETPSLDNILSLTNRFDDILGVPTSSDEITRGEADISNMETSISACPTPTHRIHKDHPKSRKGKRKDKISSKEIVFTKGDESSSVLTPEITSDSESECDSQEPLPPLLKLIGATPYGTSERVISLSDLTLNMANLTLDTLNPKRTRPSIKVPGLDHVSTVDLGIISMMIATQSPSALLVDPVTISPKNT
nr:hypothetical protein [Tanacetum cinerariifolium]